MEKKVSIIVPVYNAEKYLGYTISSIRRQTYQNIEIILVNDGSTDGSLQICRNYAAIDPRVRVIDLPNGGVSAARNRGLAEATGEYVQFVDADDVIHADMTRRLVEVMETYQKDLVVCGFQMIMLDENLEKTGEAFFSSTYFGRECVMTQRMFFQNMALLLWKSCLLEGPCNRLYRRKVIESGQILFPSDISLGEDFCFNMDYFRYMNGVVFIAEIYYYYLKNRKDSLTGCYREDLFENQLFLVQRFEKLLLDFDMYTQEQERLVATYLVAKVIQSLENLFREECSLQMRKKKEYMETIVNHNTVRNAFEKADYIDPSYEWIKEKIKFSDICGIYEWLEKNTGKDAAVGEQVKPVVQRGILNHILVGCCDLILKKYPSIRIQVVRDCLYFDGIKRTVRKVKEHMLWLQDCM